MQNNVDKAVKFIYRKNKIGKINFYEVGKINIPRQYDEWCDARVFEGFWGEDETSVKKIVDYLNS